MASAIKREKLFDLKAITKAYESDWSEDRSTVENRRRLFEFARQSLVAGSDLIRHNFEKNNASGADNVRATCFLIDELLRFALNITTTRIYPTAEVTSAERICLVCTGGYGRGELAPFSDLDLMFLLPYRLNPRVEQIVESILYMLWDLGLKVGHATRTVEEVIRLSRNDITIRTAILESRFLWGNRKLFMHMRRQFRTKIISETGSAFAQAKLAERDQRHERMGNSRYVLEPNLKEGKGGLRDLHTLFWIGKYLYQVDAVHDLVKKGVITMAESRRFSKAQNFLWTVRSHLHYLAMRGEDRLTFDVQEQIGRRMGYRDHSGTLGVERFMKHYYLTVKEVGDLTRIFCAALEAEFQSYNVFSFRALDIFRRDIEGFKLESGRLSVEMGTEFLADPVNIFRLFRTAQVHKRDIHPRALKLITRHLKLIDSIRDNPEANALFLQILTDSNRAEVTLRRLNESGVFGRFIPDFGRVVAQMQHDMYHVYTVDEHTIFAIGILHGIEQGRFKSDMPVASEVIHKLSSKRALYVAILLHDIAKGRNGDHSVLGGNIARELCPRLGLISEESETVEWLVRHHLLMSHFAFHRDLSDPKSIVDFAKQVQSLERLRLLLCLTIADIRAVGPNVWNNWKASLLRELYYATEDELSGGHNTTGRETRVESAKVCLSAALINENWSKKDVGEILSLGYPSYWLSFDKDAHLRHAKLMREAHKNNNNIAFDTREDNNQAITEFIIYTPDYAGLFSTIAGAIAISGSNIVGAKIFTMTNGMALDVFAVQDSNGNIFESKNDLERLVARVEQALCGEWNPTQELKKKNIIQGRDNVFSVLPRVLINNNASLTHSVIEINGRDRTGFLHDVTLTLAELGLQVSSALVTTYGERVVDVFYVKDGFGMQITNERKLLQIKNALLSTLGEVIDGYPNKPLNMDQISGVKADQHRSRSFSKKLAG